jgi:hypothetical protein
MIVSRLPESGRARVVTKSVVQGEPYIREQTFATRWLTRNAERESAQRFFVRGSNHAAIAKFAAIRGRQMSLDQILWFETETRGPFQNATFRHGVLAEPTKTLGLSGLQGT